MATCLRVSRVKAAGHLIDETHLRMSELGRPFGGRKYGPERSVGTCPVALSKCVLSHFPTLMVVAHSSITTLTEPGGRSPLRMVVNAHSATVARATRILLYWLTRARFASSRMDVRPGSDSGLEDISVPARAPRNGKARAPDSFFFVCFAIPTDGANFASQFPKRYASSRGPFVLLCAWK